KGRWTPADFGLATATLEDLKGGDPEANAAIVRGVLEGEPGPRRDIVIANAAAALFVAQRAPDLRSAVSLAADSIDSGAARRKIEEVIEFTANFSHEKDLDARVRDSKSLTDTCGATASPVRAGFCAHARGIAELPRL